MGRQRQLAVYDNTEVASGVRDGDASADHQDRYPSPHPHFFSSDFGNSHDPAGLGLWARAPLCLPMAALLP